MTTDLGAALPWDIAETAKGWAGAGLTGRGRQALFQGKKALWNHRWAFPVPASSG